MSYEAKYLPEFDILDRTVHIVGRLITRAPLHIGSGEVQRKPSGIDNTFLKIKVGDTEQVYIPGSSIKGVLRSVVETVLKAKNPAYACDPFINGSNPNCETCSLFGSTKRASVVEIKDLIPKSPVNLEARTGIGIDRDTGAVHPTGPFTFEIVPPSTEFPFEAYFENPANYQLGLFVVAIQALNVGIARIGGVKSRGLGEVELQIEGIEFRFPFAKVSENKLIQGNKTLVEIIEDKISVTPIKSPDVQLAVSGTPSIREDEIYGIAMIGKPNLTDIVKCAKEVLG